jgi:hypothetical protein
LPAYTKRPFFDFSIIPISAAAITEDASNNFPISFRRCTVPAVASHDSTRSLVEQLCGGSDGNHKDKGEMWTPAVL